MNSQLTHVFTQALRFRCRQGRSGTLRAADQVIAREPADAAHEGHRNINTGRTVAALILRQTPVQHGQAAVAIGDADETSLMSCRRRNLEPVAAILALNRTCKHVRVTVCPDRLAGQVAAYNKPQPVVFRLVAEW